MKVRVPSCDPPEVTMQYNYFRTVSEVEIADTCPKCGGPRGKPHNGFVFDGSRRVYCDEWDNPCGHVDKYADVIEEAKELREKHGQEM